ncbi:MAG: NAD(P)-dependent alcohol dehydrogenase [Candidatus Lutacidiplasmatales archaeon]
MVWTAYGAPEVLHLEDVPKPVPNSDELLIRVRAAGVAAGDCELRALRFGLGMRVLVRLLMGPLRPRRKVLGQQFAGDVEAVGRKVTRFRVGDPVYGTTGFGFGAYAEYLCLREGFRDGAVATKPADMTYEEAATIPTGGLEALHFLRKAGTLQGRRVLVNGAGGGIGTLAVQLAKSLGADVTGVETTRKLELVTRLGADRVIDFTKEDFTKRSETYDTIFDAVGRSPLSAGLGALRRGGFYLLANPRISSMIRAPWVSSRSGKRVVVRGSPPRTEDLDLLRGLIEAGKLHSSIDSRTDWRSCRRPTGVSTPDSISEAWSSPCR